MGCLYYCKNKRRRELVRCKRGIYGDLLNGIDHLEVSSDRKTLKIHFIHNLPGQENGIPSDSPPLTEDNVTIEGGGQVRKVKVGHAESRGNLLILLVDSPRDSSFYELRLVESPNDPKPKSGFDPQLSVVEFSFKATRTDEFDRRSPMVGSDDRSKEPLIDYLAKDYASFRHLMLDRLSVIVPEWKERNPSDLGVALVELLAHVSDYLSYYQDAVATEAYLSTARHRVSIRRHARLLDYRIDEGCNARVWVYFEIEGEKPLLLAKDELRLSTRCGDDPVLDISNRDELVAAYNPEFFELLHDVILYPSHNQIFFYTWGDDLYTLPKGSTSATLEVQKEPLHLRQGDVLVLEEMLGTKTGEVFDADPMHRHAVRLIHVDSGKDILTGNDIVRIKWHPEDALPFPLQISTRIGGRLVRNVSCIRGNVALADHGITYKEEQLVPSVVSRSGSYRPKLRHKNITFSTVYDHDRARKESSAYSTIRQVSYKARPVIRLRCGDDELSERCDLLNSDRFSSEFVAETMDDGTVYLRFGDGIRGRRPTPGSTPIASYRTGNGVKGNVGAESIAHIFPVNKEMRATISSLKRIKTIRNPIAASGGTDPELTSQVRHYAPHEFRKNRRAITEVDYAILAKRHPEVMNAIATLRWTGSWHTMFVTVDRKGGLEMDSEFRATLCTFLEEFRMAGHDIEIEPPSFVPLYIALRVHVEPDYLGSDVKDNILEIFSNTDLPDGRRGFFHPDNFTFGQSVYLSQVIDTTMGVSGVSWVEVEEFRRWGELPQGEIQQGMILLERLEIARLDNDSAAPENGCINLFMEGGL